MIKDDGLKVKELRKANGGNYTDMMREYYLKKISRRDSAIEVLVMALAVETIVIGLFLWAVAR